MMFWVIAAALGLACCAVLALALLRAPARLAGSGDEQRGDVAIYKAQLAELDRDLEAGAISAAEAEAARAELGRELLRNRDRAADTAAPGRASKVLGIALIPVVLVIAGATYAVIGSPDTPDLPISERPEVRQRAELLAAVSQAEQRLVQTPDDVRGWQVLGPIYMRLERYGDAANAFAKVLSLSEPTADMETNLAEALMFADEGRASADVLTLLRSAASRDPDHARSRFYLAGEATRTGQFDEAIDLWQQVLDKSPEDAPWLEIARAGLAFAEQQQTVGSAAPPLVDAPPGLADDIAGLEAEDRQAAIRSMVEGLTERLANEGGTPQEWARLIRSRMVLGEPERAREALDNGLEALDNQSQRDELLALVEEIGLPTAAETPPAPVQEQ